MIDTAALATLRRDLVEAHRQLRFLEDDFPIIRATAESEAISQYADPKQMGANEADRKRALILALAGDFKYMQAESDLRQAQNEVEGITMEITIIEDRRRTAEWEIRARLVEVMTTSTPLVITNNSISLTGAELTQVADLGQ